MPDKKKRILVKDLQSARTRPPSNAPVLVTSVEEVGEINPGFGVSLKADGAKGKAVVVWPSR
jgi:hypothetical protein